MKLDDKLARALADAELFSRVLPGHIAALKDNLNRDRLEDAWYAVRSLQEQVPILMDVLKTTLKLLRPLERELGELPEDP